MAFDEYLVSISAVIATSQNEADVKKVEYAKLPGDLKRVLDEKNATHDVSIYRV